MDVQQLNVTMAAADAENPSGAWAGAPAYAAATDLVNTSGHAVDVYLSAGTVTVVKVDGVTTGLTAGVFRLKRGGILHVTSSADPTLAWVYSS